MEEVYTRKGKDLCDSWYSYPRGMQTMEVWLDEVTRDEDRHERSIIRTSFYRQNAIKTLAAREMDARAAKAAYDVLPLSAKAEVKALKAVECAKGIGFIAIHAIYMVLLIAVVVRVLNALGHAFD